MCAELFNLTGATNFDNRGNATGATGFGLISTASNNPRVIQIVFKYRF